MLSAHFAKINDFGLRLVSKPPFKDFGTNNFNVLDLTKWVMKQALVGIT